MTFFLVILGFFVLIGFVRFMIRESKTQNPSDMDIIRQHKRAMNANDVGQYNKEMERLERMMRNGSKNME